MSYGLNIFVTMMTVLTFRYSFSNSNLAAKSDSCETIVFSPSLESLIAKTAETVDKINNGTSLCKNQLACQPNTVGICYANVTLDAFTGYQVTPHPVYTALLETIKMEGDSDHPDLKGGRPCAAFSYLVSQKEICDTTTFNKAYPDFGRERAVDKFIDDFTSPTKKTTASYVKSILSELMGIVVVSENDSVKKLFHETFYEVKGKINLNKEKFPSLIWAYKKFLEREGFTDPTELAHTKKLLESFVSGNDFKNFSEFQSEIEEYIIANPSNHKKIYTQALVMMRLCLAAKAFKENPIYNQPVDYYYNEIGDDKSESKILSLLYDSKTKKNASSKLMLPDFIAVDLNKILGLKEGKPAWHAMSVLGQTWLPASYFGTGAKNGSCSLVLKDSNPYYTKQECESRVSDKVYSVYDPQTYSCYYFFPKFTLLNADKEIMSYYCHLGSKRDLSTVRGEIEKIKGR